MRAAQPVARTRPEIPTPPSKTVWPGVAGERGAAGMTDQIRIAHAAGSRKDRLSSSGQKRPHSWSEGKRRPEGRLLFCHPTTGVLIPNSASSCSTPFATSAMNMISAQTRFAFVARENRRTLFRMMLWRRRAKMAGFAKNRQVFQVAKPAFAV
jgi:hypothetical protein